MPKVHVRLHPATRQVVPGRAIPVDIEIVSEQDVGDVEFRLKPGAAWRFDRGDRQWKGRLGVGSRVKLHAVLTPMRAKVDKVLAEVVMPQRGATMTTQLDLQPDIPVRGLGRLEAPGTAAPSNITPRIDAGNDLARSLAPFAAAPSASAPAATSPSTNSAHVRASAPDCSVTVSGRFMYWDDDNDGDGPDVSDPHYMRYALVYVWDYDCNGDDELIASGRTNSMGYFSLTGSISDDDDDCSGPAPDVYVEVAAEGGAMIPNVAAVAPDGGETVYAFITTVFTDVCGSLNVGTWMPPAGQEPAWHLMNSISEAWEFMTDYTNPDPPGVVERWPSSMWPNYNGEINIDAGHSWDEGCHVHEYGHFIQNLYLAYPETDYCNGICDDPDRCGHCAWAPEHAPMSYLEGWPDYFANAVNVDYGHDTPQNYEGTHHPHGREDFQNIEGYWAAVFWDIHDMASDDHDGDGMRDMLWEGFGPQWNVMVTYHPMTLWDFWNGWVALYPSKREELWETMFENHIYMPDPTEPDDTCPAPPQHTVPADGVARWHTFEDGGDQDWYRIEIMGPCVNYLIDTLVETGQPYFGCTDTVLHLYDSDCTTLLAENDDFSGKFCSLISFTQYDEPAKVCFLKVTRGYYGGTPYSVRVKVNCASPDPYEPDNTCPPIAGHLVQVNSAPTERAIWPAGDQDWVGFLAVRGMTYVVETLPRQPNIACTDTVLTLYRNDCSTVIAENDNFGSTACSRVTWTANETAYVYVKVRGYGNNRIGPYKLSITCQGDFFEPDNGPADAKAIAADGAVQERNLCGPGDEDWVRLNVLCGMTYTIQTKRLLQNALCTDTVLELYDSDGATLLASNDNYGLNSCSRVDWTADWSKTVYICVHGAASYSSGTYGLKVTVEPDAFEPDDSCAQAKPIPTDGSIQAHSAWPPFDEDWVTFNATTGWEYHISTLPWPNTCPCTDTKLTLYAADCTTVLASNDNYAGTPCSRIDWVADATAPVYVKIVAHTPFNATPGPYGLQVRPTSPYPIAAFIWTPLNPTCADTVQFRDNSSNGAETQIVSWAWDFNDGHTSTDENPTHRFADNGQYRVCLRVTDDGEQTSTGCHTITVTNACPSAVFEFVPAAPAPDQEVTFSNRSQDPCGSITDCLWDFGDGTTLSDCGGMVTHTYHSPGFYEVCLTVTDDDGCQDFRCQVVGVYCYPTAAFTWSPANPTCADTVRFTDQSTIVGENCSIAQWQWDFGDGQNSTEQNPAHHYAHAGAYQVCLMVMDTEGTERTTCQTVTVDNICPTAAFEFGPADLEGPGLVVGAIVSFENESTDPCGSIASCSWDFGDGIPSTDCSPSHVFAAPGTYNVCLTVTDDDGCTSNVCHQVTINPACSPIVAFASSPQKPTCADTIQFTGRASDRPGCSIVAWAWDFGDGQTSTDQNPTHHYAHAGTYTVCLTVTDSANLTKTFCQIIQVGPACPAASFQHEPAQACPGGQVQFTNTSTDPCASIASCSWDFGDRTTSTECNPQHIFTAPGTYNVCLTVTDDDGCRKSVCQSVLVADTVPPTISCPPNATRVTLCSGCVAVNLGQPTCTDNCDPHPVCTNDAPACFSPGIHTVTWTCRDASGNTATCQQTVRVWTLSDAAVQQFRCPNNVRAGTTRPLVAVVQNLGLTSCSFEVRFERTGASPALLCSRTVTLGPGQRRDVSCDYAFRAADVPQACFVARILPASDANPANNQQEGCTEVRPAR
jgi:PKD repeat protein